MTRDIYEAILYAHGIENNRIAHLTNQRIENIGKDLDVNATHYPAITATGFSLQR